MALCPEDTHIAPCRRPPMDLLTKFAVPPEQVVEPDIEQPRTEQGTMNPVKALEQHGQSVWLDFLARGFVVKGELKKLIDNDGVKGVTSNPSIFEKAIGSAERYASAIAREPELDDPAPHEGGLRNPHPDTDQRQDLCDLHLRHY